MEKTKGIEEFVPALFFVDRAVESGARPCTGAIIWATPRGSDDAFDRQQRVNPRIEELLRAGLRVIVPDVLGVGRHRGKLPPADRKSKDKYAGYALCYNRPLVAERVRDLGTTLAAVRDLFPKVGIGLVGLEDAGVWATLAGAIDGACFLVVDWSTAGATESVELNDPTTLPGLRKYGGLSACLEILHVGPVLINAEGRMDAAHTTRARERLGLAPLPLVSTSATDSARAAVAWILSLPKSAARSN